MSFDIFSFIIGKASSGGGGGSTKNPCIVGYQADNEYTASSSNTNSINSHWFYPYSAPGSGFYNWWGGTGTQQHWWKVKFATPQTIIKVAFANYWNLNGTSYQWQSKSVTLQGSNDNSTWVDLLVLTNLEASNSQVSHDVTNTTAYTYYRFVCTSGGTPYTGLGKIQMYTEGGNIVLGEKSITDNGTYLARNDNYDGYSKVNVNVSGGSSYCVEEWDFTQSLVGKQKGLIATLNGGDIERNENGIVFGASRNGYVSIPTIFIGMTLEVDITNMSATSGSHNRVIMVNDGNGFIYRSTGYFSLYNGSSWATDSSISNASFFDGHTLKIYIDQNKYWHIYKDNELVYEPNVALDVPSGNKRDFTIGALSQGLQGTTITGVRIS